MKSWTGFRWRLSDQSDFVRERLVWLGPETFSKPEVGVNEDVRTLSGKSAEWAQEMLRDLQTEEGQRISHNIRVLRELFEPEVVAKEHAGLQASRSLRARGARGACRASGADASPPMLPQW